MVIRLYDLVLSFSLLSDSYFHLTLTPYHRLLDMTILSRSRYQNIHSCTLHGIYAKIQLMLNC